MLRGCWAITLTGMVLVVDDSVEICMAVVKFIEILGHPAQCLTNPTVALDRMKAIAPVVVVLDDAMPEVTGLELLQAMKADEMLRAIPVVMHTASINDQRREMARRLGATVVAKGDPTELMNVVSRYLPN
ncbi:MAG TPA: response regulator [Tepidisphaeraceae bacterium]|jgi:CheY-like chemotaxis protein